MRTSGKIDFRFCLKLYITLVRSTYSSQRPQCPSLSPHFPFDLVYLAAGENVSFRVQFSLIEKVTKDFMLQLKHFGLRLTILPYIIF